jgi:hypothetical protein
MIVGVAVEGVIPRELRRFIVSRRAGRQIAGFGGDATDDHAVQIIVVDHQETRRLLPGPRHRSEGQVVLIRPKHFGLSEHADPRRNLITRSASQYVRRAKFGLMGLAQFEFSRHGTNAVSRQ